MRLIFFFTLIYVLFLPGEARALRLFDKEPVIHGFMEHASGFTFDNPKTKHGDYNMMEQRLQLKSSYYYRGESFVRKWRPKINFKGDFVLDEYFGYKTSFEMRELNVFFTPIRIMDLKIGRQILTWGTGDYLFINDLFPKDYVSFYIGRDDEYLKKPSDAIRLSVYPGFANIDIAIIPFFESNNVPKGDRLSFFDSFNKGIAGRKVDRFLVEPADQPENTEIAVRTYKNIGSYEWAIYFFRGFSKTPRSYKNESLRQLYYRRLDVYGASIRGPWAGGIANAEVGYYNSREDSEGDDRLVENSFFKALAGYDIDFGNEFRAGFQYFYERRLDYDEYRNALLPRDYFWDEQRHLVTNRLTKHLKNQTLELSLFTFYSPSDNDVYTRPSLTYDITDSWEFTFGANLVWGEDDITEFGQMEENKNAYFRLRYSF